MKITVARRAGRSRSHSPPRSAPLHENGHCKAKTRQGRKRGLFSAVFGRIISRYLCSGSSSRQHDVNSKNKDGSIDLASSSTPAERTDEPLTTATSGTCSTTVSPELKAQRIKNGQCTNCGQQTHEVVDDSINSAMASRPATMSAKNTIRKTAITLIPDKVVCGLCVKCNRVNGYESLYNPQGACNTAVPCNNPEWLSLEPSSDSDGFRSDKNDDDDEEGTVVSAITMDSFIIPREDFSMTTDPRHRSQVEAEQEIDYNPIHQNHWRYSNGVDPPPPPYGSITSDRGSNAFVQRPTSQYPQQAMRPPVVYNKNAYQESLTAYDRKILENFNKHRKQQEMEAREERLAEEMRQAQAERQAEEMKQAQLLQVHHYQQRLPVAQASVVDTASFSPYERKVAEYMNAGNPPPQHQQEVRHVRSHSCDKTASNHSSTNTNDASNVRRVDDATILKYERKAMEYMR